MAMRNSPPGLCRPTKERTFRPHRPVLSLSPAPVPPARWHREKADKGPGSESQGRSCSRTAHASLARSETDPRARDPAAVTDEGRRRLGGPAGTAAHPSRPPQPGRRPALGTGQHVAWSLQRGGLTAWVPALGGGHKLKNVFCHPPPLGFTTGRGTLDGTQTRETHAMGHTCSWRPKVSSRTEP